MTQRVQAIYESGVLRPLKNLDLEEHDLVSLAIDKVAPDGREGEAHRRTFFELLDEAGLVGCIQDAPADLSTNPKYLEGFGKSGT